VLVQMASAATKKANGDKSPLLSNKQQQQQQQQHPALDEKTVDTEEMSKAIKSHIDDISKMLTDQKDVVEKGAITLLDGKDSAMADDIEYARLKEEYFDRSEEYKKVLLAVLRELRTVCNEDVKNLCRQRARSNTVSAVAPPRPDEKKMKESEQKVKSCVDKFFSEYAQLDHVISSLDGTCQQIVAKLAKTSKDLTFQKLTARILQFGSLVMSFLAGVALALIGIVFVDGLENKIMIALSAIRIVVAGGPLFKKYGKQADAIEDTRDEHSAFRRGFAEIAMKLQLSKIAMKETKDRLTTIKVETMPDFEEYYKISTDLGNLIDAVEDWKIVKPRKLIQSPKK